MSHTLYQAGPQSWALPTWGSARVERRTIGWGEGEISRTLMFHSETFLKFLFVTLKFHAQTVLALKWKLLKFD